MHYANLYVSDKALRISPPSHRPQRPTYENHQLVIESYMVGLARGKAECSRASDICLKIGVSTKGD